jgi:hypothetical protein
MTVKRNRMPADYDKLCACVVEFDQEIAEVRGEIDHVSRPRTNR